MLNERCCKLSKNLGLCSVSIFTSVLLSMKAEIKDRSGLPPDVFKLATHTSEGSAVKSMLVSGFKGISSWSNEEAAAVADLLLSIDNKTLLGQLGSLAQKQVGTRRAW